MRTIRVSDLLMHDDLSIEELVKEFCEEGDFTLIDFEEYDDRYEEDGSQLAQVLIRVDDDPFPNPADVYNQRIEEIAKIVHSNSEESERLLKHEYPLDNNLSDCRDIKDKYELSWTDLKNVWRKCHSYKKQNEAKSKYDKSNTKMVSLKLNQKTDADILAVLEKEENVQGFIKSCIRKNIKEICYEE